MVTQRKKKEPSKFIIPLDHPVNDFIFEGEMDFSVCEQMIDLFEKNPDKHASGKLTDLYTKGEEVQDYKKKRSRDMECWKFGEDNDIIVNYMGQLQKVLDQYLKLYTMANELPPFWATIPRIQRYDKKGHFNHWHFERGGNQTINRCLVYMTYLNDVEEGGETDFLYQKKSFQPRTGKTLIWPSEWTYTHKGMGPKRGYKYIATGWYVHQVDNEGKNVI